MTFTTRLTVEIPGIAYEDIEKVKAYVAKEQLETGGTGAKVRPVVACKGTTCVFGLIDTQGLAKEIHDRFYKGYGSVALPHKFKIAVGGCPNNCVKPDLNDVGIMGQRVPALNKSLCRGCKKMPCAGRMSHGCDEGQRWGHPPGQIDLQQLRPLHHHVSFRRYAGWDGGL